MRELHEQDNVPPFHKETGPMRTTTFASTGSCVSPRDYRVARPRDRHLVRFALCIVFALAGMGMAEQARGQITYQLQDNDQADQNGWKLSGSITTDGNTTTPLTNDDITKWSINLTPPQFERDTDIT
jgi:hypothetical protein